MTSIARLIATFGKLTEIEAAINAAVIKSKVPLNEVRVMLRSMVPAQAENTPLHQYMKTIFQDIGIGTLRVARTDPFRWVYSIPDSQVPSLFPDVRGKTCYVTSDAIKLFYEKALEIPSEVREIRCKNEGAEACEFEVRMQPLAVYNSIIDDVDMNILKTLKDGGTVDRDNEEIAFRLEILRTYRLLGEGYAITDIGIKFLEYRSKLPPAEERERPWKTLTEASEVAASAKSFAEAFSKAVGEGEVVEIVDESKVINVIDEAKSSKSFAELLAKSLKEVSEDDEW